MNKIKDLTNQKFNYLTAIKCFGKDKNNKALWLFKCDCGNEKILRGTNVTKGNIKSCGCKAKSVNFDKIPKEKLEQKYKTHGYKIRHKKELYANNKSGATGVFWYEVKKKYLCSVCVNGVIKTAYKKTFEEAVAWRKNKMIEMERRVKMNVDQKKIRALCALKGIKVSALQEILGLQSRTSIYNKLNGKSKFTLNDVAKLTKYFNVSIETIMEEK